MALILSDAEVARLKENHFGLAYCQFINMVCEGCEHPCYVGEEHCAKFDEMRKQFGF